jgi:hypothetical protein
VQTVILPLFRTVGKDKKNPGKLAKCLLYTLECTVIVMVWIAVLLLLLIYIRWAILHLGIFILELFLTRENMKNK